MDSRSGPELSNKVHGFRETVKLRHPILYRLAGASFLAVVVLVGGGCGGEPDPRTVEGALAKAADALARHDQASLFRVVDQRARHSLAAIADARHKAAEQIRKSYPAEAQAQALAALGDGADAKDAVDLFGKRCPQSCMEELSQKVGAPAEVKSQGADTLVKTTRGSEVLLHKGTDTWYGLVWNTEALMRERDRAAAELELVQKNAELYEKQKSLK